MTLTIDSEKLTYIDVDSIRLDGATQQRAKMNLTHIHTLEDALSEISELEPVQVVYDGNDYWLVDGFHRIFAYKHCDRQVIPAIVTEGTQRDAILASKAANAENLALPRTRADKHKAVTTLLLDPEWSQKSDLQISKIAKVSHNTVAAIRKSLVVNCQLENIDKVTTVTNSNGTTYERTIKAKTKPSNQFKDGDYGGSKVPIDAITVVETPKSTVIENDLTEWFQGFMARFQEFPDSYIAEIKKKIREREKI